MLSPRARDNIAGFLFISPWLLNMLVLISLAMVTSLVISFYEADFLTTFEPVGLRNYQQMIRDPLFFKSLVNTAYYTFGMVPLGIVFAIAIAVLLNQRVRALGVFRTLYYLPSIVSGVAVSILWMYLLNPRFGLINQGLALIGIDGPKWVYSEDWAIPSFIMMGVWAAGSNMLLYLAGLQGIPTELYEAARIDGSGAWHCFWHITLPMLSPTIFFNLVMSIIGAWQVFTQSYVMTGGGPNNATLTMVLYLYRKAFQQFHFGYASALAWALFAIVMVFTLLVFRSSDAWVFYAGELRR
ncbi:MAG: carbohydrate ABC transporter permease [Anaerolineae bacterium]